MRTWCRGSVRQLAVKSILDGMQEKTFRWSGRSGCRTRFSFEDRRHRVAGELSARDFKHGADGVTDHVVEESIAANAIDKQIRRRLYRGLRGGL